MSTASKIRQRLQTGREWLDAAWAEAHGKTPKAYGTPAQAFRNWVGGLGAVPSVKGRVLVTALRSNTWIEWSVYAACVLRRMGYASTLLFSGAEIRRIYRQNLMLIAARIPDVELVDLDSLPPAPAKAAHLLPIAQEVGPAALAYDHHVEEENVRDVRSPLYPKLPAYLERLCRIGAAFDAWLDGRRFHRFLCYSGLISESTMLLRAAKEHGLETVCLEGWAWRPGHLIYNLNAPALEYNIEGWLAALGGWDEAKDREVTAYLKFLDQESEPTEDWLNNYYAIQKSKISADLPPALAAFLTGPEPVFVLAPNVIGDSSMVRRETIFPGQQSWTKAVIEHFRGHPGAKLVVRAHPAEVWVGGKCAVHMGEVARNAAANATNILVLDAKDKVNTFSLLPFARAGLVWVSSAGVDFVVRGVPVAVAAKPKYEGMGIVEMPASREAYFGLIERWAQRQERPTKEQVTAGKRYLHLVFKGFSFEAGARNFRATQLVLGGMPSQQEHDRFFRVLVGEEPMPDVEALRKCQSARG